MGNKLVLRSEGVKSMLKSPEIMAVCRSHAESINSRVGDGYEVSEYTGANRVNVSVHAVSEEAKQDNLDNNSLLKAVN